MMNSVKYKHYQLQWWRQYISIRTEKERNKGSVGDIHIFQCNATLAEPRKKGKQTLPKYYWSSISHDVQNQLLMNYNLILKGKTKVLRRQEGDLRRGIVK